jgi:hypothetical protein
MLKVCARHGLIPMTGCEICKHADSRRRNQRVKTYGYSSKNWQQIRQARRQISGGYCELKLPGCTQIATHTHLDPRLRGQHQVATVNDAQACCSSCSGAIDAPRSQKTQAC